MPLDLDEAFWTTTAVTQFTRMFILDRLWTCYLAEARPPISEGDVSALGRITDEMRTLLEQVPDRAGYLDHLIITHTDEVVAAYPNLLEQEVPNEGDRGLLREKIERGDGIIAYSRTHLNALAGMAYEERATLTAKMETIRQGGFTPGDLSPSFLCDVAAGCIVGAVLAVAVPPPASGIALATGIAIYGFLRLRGMDCL